MKRLSTPLVVVLAVLASSSAAAEFPPLPLRAVTTVLELEGTKVHVGKVVQLADKTAATAPTETKPQPVDMWLVPVRNTVAFQWIAAFVDGTASTKALALDRVGADKTVMQRTNLGDSVITEIGFPPADVNNKDAVRLRVRVQPSTLATAAGAGKLDAGLPPGPWLSQNFRFTIDGLVGKKVSKVSAFVVRAGTPTKLVVELSEEYAEPWYVWFQAAVIGGSGETKNATLQYLDSTNTTSLATVACQQATPAKIAAAPQMNNEDKIASVQVTLTCGAVHLK